jgi:tetratricopeptide (TPR) repeat protein
MKIILEEHPDLDMIYLSEQQKEIHPDDYPNIHIFFAKNIRDIWQHWKEHISPIWLTNSIPFLNHELRFLRQLRDFHSEYQWISSEQIRLRYEELIQLGMHYIKNSTNIEELPSKVLIEQATFYINAGYYYNHYGNLQHAEKIYQKFLNIWKILERKGDVTEGILHGLNQMAIFFRDVYDYKNATALLDNVLNSQKFRYLPNIEKATWYRSRALIALDLKDFDLAEKLLKKSAKIAQKSKDSFARQQNLEMELACKKRNAEKARKINQNLLNQFHQDPLNAGYILIYILKYQTYFGGEISTEIQNVINDLLLGRIKCENYAQGMILHWYARWCIRNHDVNEALKSLDQSTASFLSMNSPDTNLLALGNQWLKADLLSYEKQKKKIEENILQIPIPSIAAYLKAVMQSAPIFLPEILHF